MKTVLFILENLKCRLMAEMEYKVSFLLQVVGMVVNNCFFVLVWYFIFNFSGNDINGWQFADQMYLFATGAFAFGILWYFLGGVSRLSNYIYEGNLDKFLLFPKNLLLQVTFSWGGLASLGDMISAVLVMFLVPGNILLNILKVSSLGFLGGLVLWGVVLFGESLTFWFGNSQKFAKSFFGSTFQFSIYPGALYTGILKVIIFVVFPAGFISVVPVELIREFSWGKFIFLLVGVALWTVIPTLVFYRGLRDYNSGNQINTTS